jgi:TIR domain-containing protein
MLGNLGLALTQAFISYAHDDYRAFEEFHVRLKPLARLFKLNIWADKRLLPGDYWSSEIAAQIELSDIHVLLMSARFFGSDYILDHELPAIAARCQNGALTIPVLIERCVWYAFVSQLQVAPMDEKGRLVAIRDWKPQRTGFSSAYDQIAKAIEDHLHRPPATLLHWGKP